MVVICIMNFVLLFYFFFLVCVVVGEKVLWNRVIERVGYCEY